jgi:anti-sigma regulatory factor (Ser/Thr protein kinase)
VAGAILPADRPPRASPGQGTMTRRAGLGVAEVWGGLLAGGTRDALAAGSVLLLPLFLPLSSGQYLMSPEHTVPSHPLPGRGLPPPAPAGDAVSHTYREDLSPVRALVFAHAREAGLPEGRANDLVLAVSEVAANTLRYTQSAGTLTLWHDDGEIVCEVHDAGIIADPLVGRRRPPPDASGGHGLWLVHQVCDRVELHSDASGTTVRMHMALSSPPAVG